MLKENPELYQLYKDLVKGGIVTAEEFWENRKAVSNLTTLVYPYSLRSRGWLKGSFFPPRSPQGLGCPNAILNEFYLSDLNLEAFGL